MSTRYFKCSHQRGQAKGDRYMPRESTLDLSVIVTVLNHLNSISQRLAKEIIQAVKEGSWATKVCLETTFTRALCVSSDVNTKIF